MSKIEMLRLLINQRLTEAAEEIFGVFGRTIAEYEEEISRSKLEIERQRRLLDLHKKPQISLQVNSSALPQHGACSLNPFQPSADPRARSENTLPSLSEQQEWSSSLDLNQIKPPPIKEEDEDEELWPPQREETPQTAEQNDGKFVLFQSGGVRNAQDNHHMTSSLSTRPCQDLDDSELDPQPGTSVPQTCSDLGEDAPEASDQASGNGQPDCIELDAPLSEVVDSYICTICGRAFAQRGHWAKHVQVHRKVESKADKSYTCDICGKRLTRFDGYQKHLRIHTGEKPYSCDECGRRFSDNSNYKRHIRTHTGLKQS
ncbi:zinc finger and SCAN domain-containing protein 12-like isoform X1 [Micropterus dolomieu]|uniref:zinc finger and SCAN domain-containing protein 12-like isoform X1 n=1 Tax=Micropterus dolomieu TaxID=147949 RepID=UPI001E8E6FCA|nr:zinc finger and SCAN domain-containing protein 12-like isoform X1 [Micropterus dolomieu]